jgi:membrane protease YdiL (CAAX protease family)
MSSVSDEPIEFDAPRPAPPPEPVKAARPLRIWTVFGVFAAAVVGCMAAQIPVAVSMVVIAIVEGTPPDKAMENMTPWAFVALGAPAQLVMLALWWLALSFGDPRARSLRAIGSARLSPLAYPCFAAASMAVLMAGGLLANVYMELVGDEQIEKIAEMYKTVTWPSGIVLVLFITLAPAFVEELFFRGYLQRRLLARWHPAVAILVVGLLFAAFHGTPAWALAVFPLGLWFGVLAWRTGSLWPGIACHAFVNGSVNAWRVGAVLGVLPRDVPSWVTFSALAITVACAAVSAWILARYRWQTLEPAEATQLAVASSPISAGSSPHKSPIESTTTSGR